MTNELIKALEQSAEIAAKASEVVAAKLGVMPGEPMHGELVSAIMADVRAKQGAN